MALAIYNTFLWQMAMMTSSLQSKVGATNTKCGHIGTHSARTLMDSSSLHHSNPIHGPVQVLLNIVPRSALGGSLPIPSLVSCTILWL
jgi:hypothetical protein